MLSSKSLNVWEADTACQTNDSFIFIRAYLLDFLVVVCILSIKAKALILSLFYIQRVLIHRFDNGGKLSFQGYVIFVGMKYFMFAYSIQT